MPTDRAPRVFISYSHDSPEHKEAVLGLATRLRDDGVDCRMDRLEPKPKTGWLQWMMDHIEAADFILMVCTAEYKARSRPDYDREGGKGSRFETVLLLDELYAARMINERCLPVLLPGSTEDDSLLPLRRFPHYPLNSEDDYEQLLRQILDQPEVIPNEIGEAPELSQRAVAPLTFEDKTNPAGTSLPDIPFAVDPRVAGTFVGREDKLDALKRHLIDEVDDLPVAICAIDGMGGIGKSYLADRFALEHRDAFPGGYVRVTLDPQEPQDVDSTLAGLAEVLKIPAGPNLSDRVRERLIEPRTLVQVENVDSLPIQAMVVRFLEELSRCSVLVTGRLDRLGQVRGWPRVDLSILSTEDALDQLWTELDERPRDEKTISEHRRLVEALGRLPLAIHLAAGHLEVRTVDSFLRKLKKSGLTLAPVDGAESLSVGRRTEILSETLGLSVELLGRQLREKYGDRADMLLDGLYALGHAPASGFGRSLGAALAGLDEEDFDDLVLEAVKLSLLMKVPSDERPRGAWRFHPLIAELLRPHSEEREVIDRATDWFVRCLPEQVGRREGEQGEAWREIHQEGRALSWWLERVPPVDRVRVVEAGSAMARTSGDFMTWRTYLESINLEDHEPDTGSLTRWTLAQVYRFCGDLDAAEKTARQMLVVDGSRGAKRWVARAQAVIADCLKQRGKLDEALQLRTKEILPALDEMGDEMERAINFGRIADILQLQGDTNEALRIRYEEQLPVFDRLENTRGRTVALGKIADVLTMRDDLEEALKIRQGQELPFYEKLGNVRSKAVVSGKIADILLKTGAVEEALRIRREDEIPVYERLGDVREKALASGKVAIILRQRGETQEALRIWQKESLPVFQRIGEAKMIEWAKANIAELLEQIEGEEE